MEGIYEELIDIEMLIFPEPEGNLSTCTDFLSVHQAAVVIPNLEFLTRKTPQILLYLHDRADLSLAIGRKWRIYCFTEREIQNLRKRAERIKPNDVPDLKDAGSAFFGIFGSVLKKQKRKPFNVYGKLDDRSYCLQIPEENVDALLTLLEKGIEAFKTHKLELIAQALNAASVPAVSA